jgi:hypothetical protein
MKGDSTVSGLEATSQRASVGSTDAPNRTLEVSVCRTVMWSTT